ncbi:glycosyltransferase family 2 protein [Citricoccus sp. GCM10030269]|uniref:glycosyltransferase family 2 protein n=1 Tax=Citricoccus sp. GCM10030269 TaxID=3273388 RepID=UPI00360775FC
MSRRVKPSPAPSSPRVTVVIPCFNYGHFLPQAVASALDQPGVEVDVIIVDDCSTDGSQNVAVALSQLDRRVHTVLHEVNQGHITTYNDGLAQARGDYVVLLSADDVLSPGSLRRSTNLMEAEPSVGLVYGYAPAFETVPPTMGRRRETWTVWDGLEWIERMCRRGHNLIVNPEAVLRTTVMAELVGYREDMPQAADMELWIRAAAMSDVGRVNGPAQAYYRVHGNNMHRTGLSGVVRETTARLEVFRSIADLPTLPNHERRRLVQLAMSRLSREMYREAKRSWRRRDGHDPVVRQLMELAADCDPTIRRARGWAALEQRDDSEYGWADRVDETLYRLTWSLRWRRWRRFGI